MAKQTPFYHLTGHRLSLAILAFLIIFTVVDIYLLLYVHGTPSETTYILSEKVYNGKSDSSSDKFKRLLDKEEILKVAENAEDSKERPVDGKEVNKKSEHEQNKSPQKPATAKPDKVEDIRDPDVNSMIEKLKSSTPTFFPSYFWNITMDKLARKLGSAARKSAATLSGYNDLKTDKTMPAWKFVHRNIRQYSMYDPDDPQLQRLLHNMMTLPITEADENEGGTQLKINIRFSDGGRAVLKPMRYPREVEANENHYIFDDIERHVAEIAAFQLDRVLGFYRVPPTVGRLINITSELKPIVPKAIHKTFFTSPAGNLCFYGECDYYCDSAHAFCGHPDMIETSIMSYLPSRNIASRYSWYQPWRRSYSKYRKAYWEVNDDMCDSVRNEDPFNNGKFLLDLVDSHTFDFLTGNKDRHSFSTFKEFGNYSFPIMYDNGRGFGRTNYDAMSILAPLRQCCVIRKSTFLKYVKLYTGRERLSSLMEKALHFDPIAPVLTEGHLKALDRRLVKILREVATCMEHYSVQEIIITDRF